MITVHHLGVSQSERIVWLCEELGIDYGLVRYDRDPVTRLAPAAYKALHPAGLAPVIEDGGLVLAESGAIVDYLIARYGAGRLLLSASDPEFPAFLFWRNFAGATVGADDMMRIIVGASGLAQDHPIAAFVEERTRRAYAMVETRLGEAPYFGGPELTTADIMIVFHLTTARIFAPRDFSDCPHILAYLRRIGARPAYIRAMAKGDPDRAPLLA